MILRLIIAFTRWAWGMRPAFVTPPDSLDGEWGFALFVGAVLDIFAAVAVVVFVSLWLSEERKSNPARTRKG